MLGGADLERHAGGGKPTVIVDRSLPRYRPAAPAPEGLSQPGRVVLQDYAADVGDDPARRRTSWRWSPWNGRAFVAYPPDQPRRVHQNLPRHAAKHLTASASARSRNAARLWARSSYSPSLTTATTAAWRPERLMLLVAGERLA